MDAVPIPISLVFGLTTLITIYIFYRAIRSSELALVIISIWISMQTCVSLSGFYADMSTHFPRVLVLIGPPMVMMLVTFSWHKGKFFEQADMQLLTMIHLVRVPVEVVLRLLEKEHLVPACITMDGGNADFWCGVSAPLIYYFGVVQQRIGRVGVLLWNVASMALLIRSTMCLMAGMPCFPDPETDEMARSAMVYFPFIFLPGMIIPIVFFSHMAAICRCVREHVGRSRRSVLTRNQAI